MNKFLVFLCSMLVSLLMMSTTSLAAEDQVFTDDELAEMEEEMIDLGYDSELIEQSLDKLKSGDLPDVLKEDATIVSQDNRVEGNKIITTEVYEDGTYSESTVENHGEEEPLSSEDEEIGLLSAGSTQNVTVSRRNFAVYMEFSARITYVNRGDSFINSVYGQNQRSITGSVAVNNNVRIIRQSQNGSTPALAGMAVQWTGAINTPSQNFQLGILVNNTSYSRTTSF
ncbi:hypothetical protein [Alkalicoccus luteus]|uniref:Uncharacterized protein n=1 Tax=Alkalicoccus luteus TaxID=1237094 RepID=A0A969PRB9_9BACI|nr:hypothetical protein [Alkalicoccus luteus]NJP38996.1 hypothetical protein [Alkalicoccus luteus]